MAWPNESAPWTPQEKARAAEAYLRGGIAEAMRAFPGRTQASLYHVARRIGATRKRRWTSKDNGRLRLLWGSVPLPEICRTFGRTRASIMFHAVHKLGLPSGCPENLEYLSKSASRVGYTASQLRRILRWAGVQIMPAYTFVGEGDQRWLVDPLDVDDAVGEWHQTETLECAARRLHTSAETLHLWLGRIGVVAKRSNAKKRKAHFRVRSEDIEKAWRTRTEFYAAHPDKTLPRWRAA